MTAARSLLLAGAASAALLVSAKAGAYPDYIGKGYTNCVTCHYSPSGGGFVNSYGGAVQQALFPDVQPSPSISKVREKASVTGYDDEGAPALQLGLGVDSRFMLATYGFFPMLLEVGGVAAYGRLLAYGSVGPRHPEASGVGYQVLSREHWLQFRFTDTLSVRGGRMVVPFGLRIPDHTAYTRTPMGFGFYGQTYGGEVDYVGELLVVQAAGFGGDFTEQTAALRERGAAGSVTVNVASRAAIGASGLYGNSDVVDRVAAALFARVRLIGASYLLAEVDGQHRTSPDETGRRSLATFARLGFWLLESLDMFLEHGWRSEESGLAGTSNLTQSRYIAGASWWVLPWVELAPQAQLQTFPAASTQFAGFLQLHIYY